MTVSNGLKQAFAHFVLWKPLFLTASERVTKEDVRRENEALWAELSSLQREHKRLRQFIDQLSRDYEESKGFDPVRRYDKLKGMVKRTVLHLRLGTDEIGKGCSSGAISGILIQGCREYGFTVESDRRRQEAQGMSKQDLAEENQTLRNQIKDFRRQCSLIREMINQLDRHYQSSKRFSFVHRYTILKMIIKKVIHDQYL